MVYQSKPRPDGLGYNMNLFAMMDNIMLDLWRVEEDEYDFILENSTQEELDNILVINSKSTISQCKAFLKCLEEKMELYNNEMKL